MFGVIFSIDILNKRFNKNYVIYSFSKEQSYMMIFKGIV